jgi:hypothetical protein
MYTITETEIFTRESGGVWTEDERGEFCAWLAANTDAGDVVKGSGGCRKVRWKRGKSGGVRVIYRKRRNLLADALREGDDSQHPGSHPESNQGGNRK